MYIFLMKLLTNESQEYAVIDNCVRSHGKSARYRQLGWIGYYTRLWSQDDTVTISTFDGHSFGEGGSEAGQHILFFQKEEPGS